MDNVLMWTNKYLSHYTGTQTSSCQTIRKVRASSRLLIWWRHHISSWSPQIHMLHIILDSGPFVYLEHCQLPIMGCYECHCFCGYWHVVRCCMGNTSCGWLVKLSTPTTMEVFAHGKIKELNRTITLFLKLSPFMSANTSSKQMRVRSNNVQCWDVPAKSFCMWSSSSNLEAKFMAQKKRHNKKQKFPHHKTAGNKSLLIMKRDLFSSDEALKFILKSKVCDIKTTI